MSSHHLAQLNVAQLKAPLDSPQLSEFVSNLDNINQLAETSPGFLWRYTTAPGGSAMESRLFGKDHIVTMSIWTDPERLHDFVYTSAHAPIMGQRKQWFERLPIAHQVLWWIPAGTRPTLLEASRKLEYLRANGPTSSAFTFKQVWPCPTMDTGESPL